MRCFALFFLSLMLWPVTSRGETFREVNGVVSIEAEHFTKNDGYTVRSDNGPQNKAAGFSGDGWVYSDSEVAQRMDYQIRFTHTGTYYVHLRALAGLNADWTTNWEGIDNGYHAELDGTRVSGKGIFVKKKQKWYWYGSYQASSPPQAVSFTVNTAGVHTFSIVRREQLSRLDKIVIHDGTYGTDPESTLSGEGPSETLDVVPADTGVAPADTGVAPADTGVAPADAGVAPADAGVDLSTGADTGADSAPLRIEAELMSLQSYRVENGAGYASNDQMITLRDGDAGETGTASYTFNGDPGAYDVVLAYFDETDGVAHLSLQIDDALLADFDLDQDLGGAGASAKTLVRRTVASAYALERGSVIRVTGVEDPNEPARVDYVELVPVSAPTSTGKDAGLESTSDMGQDNVTASDAGPGTSPPRVENNLAGGGCSLASHDVGAPSVLLLFALGWLAWRRRRDAAS